MNTRHPLQDARFVKCLCHKQPHRWRSRFFFFLVIYLLCFAQIQPVAAISGTDTITTVVGTGTAGYGGDGSAASAAQINTVRGVAFDSAGNFYLADTSNHRVRRVDAVTGIITTVAGTGAANFGGDTGPATGAMLNTPWSLAFDSADNLYIADQSNNRIRKVDKLTGVITTFAGNGTAAFSGDNDLATKATLNAPWGITFDNADNLYIADFGNSVIRKVNTAGIITTIAGKNGSFGYGGDGLSATDPTTVMLNGVQDVACDAAGNVYIADSLNYRIREVIVATGIITTVVGTGGWGGYSGDGNPASAAAIDMVSSLTFDSTGNMYFADRGNNAIRWVDMTTGIVATLAGNGTAGFSSDGTPAASAQFDSPADLAFKRNGNLYISDLKNNRIRALGPLPPTITAVTNQVIPMNMALTALPLTVGDLDTPVTSLTLSAASSNPTLVPTGNIVLGGSGAKRTVAVTPTADLNGTAVLTLTVSDGGQTTSTSFTLTVTNLQMIATVAGTGVAGYSGDGGLATAALFNEVYAVATDSAGNLYVSDSPNHRIRRVDRTTGVITTVAGDGTMGFGGDGTLATAAQMNWPRDIAFDRAGNLYIGDTMNYRVRRVDAVTGIITTVAGNGGTGGFNGDSGVATAIQLSTLRGLACDSAGNLYIADYGNQRIRRVNIASGNIATIAGTGTGGFNGDGILATTAQINNPQSLALDSADNLYFTDGGNQRVRRVDVATGIITTVAGNGVAGFSVDGGSATAAQFAQPWGIAFDRDSYLYVADGGNQRIRRVNLAAGIVSTVVGTGVAGFSGDNGSATAAMIKPIWGNISFDSANNLYFTDGGNVRVRRVTPPPYVAPTITAVANQSVPMNGALAALPFTVGDMGAPATSLILSAASSNPALVPVANISFGGNGANRTVTLAPILEMSGTAAITLTVSDGGLSSSASFVLTVVAASPNITSAAPPAGTYAQIYSYSFTATGVPTPSFALTVGTLPPGLSLAPNGLLSGTPTASGSFAITLNATNGIQPAASASYTLVISPVPLTVTANNQSRPYGASNPVLSYSAVGFVLGDTVNVLSGTLVTTATADSPAGSYAITQGSLSAANYTLTYTPGTLIITPVGTTPCAGSTLRTLLSSQNAVIDLDGTCRYQLTETTGGNGHLINLIARNNQTINGNGAVIEGSGVLGLLTLIDSSNVTIKHVTLTGGRATEASNTLAGRGGALLIYNSTVTFDGVQLIDNRATLGGAIATVGGSTTVVNSLFAANQASEGGAAIFAQGPSTVSYSTIADSSANPNTAIFTWDSFSINNSVIANYAVALAAAGGASQPMREEANLFAQVGQRYRIYNVGSQISIGQRSLSVDTSADQFLNMSLHDYRLQESSLAVDRTAPPTGIAAFDLYGRPRPFGNSLADLGAYEFQGDHSVVALKLAPRWAATNSPFSIELQVTNRGYAPVQNLEVHDTLPSGFSLVGNLAAGGSRQGNTLIWPIATLLPNASVSLTYQVTATATTLSDGYQVLRTADQSVAASGPAVQVEISDALVALLRSPSGRIFDPASDGFGFAAWNDRTFTYPPTEFMYRLFGSGVCTKGTEGSLAACVLTATATRQSQSLQRIVNSGRTFGMAAVSLKLFRSETLADGRHLPSDFQASATTTAQLQRDLATEQVIDTYQATRVSAGSQAPLALASDGTASDVVRVLLGSGFTGADGSEAYTLQVRQPGVGGTTLLPYALERRGESSYWLYVYDPKVPGDGQRVVSLDNAANSWAYTGVDGTSYRGDSANGSIALRRLSADTALPRTCVFCAQLQAAGTLAQTSASIAFMLSGPGALLISDATGRVINVDAQGIVTVNTIPGTWIDQLDPGSGTNLPPVIYVPTGSPYRVVITSTNGTNAGVALNITAPGMIAELENLPLNAVGDSLSLLVDAATSTIRFSAGPSTRSAQKLSLAVTAPDGKSYSCTTSGFALPSGATVDLGFDPTTNQLSLSDNAQQNLRYDMLLMRVEPGGVTQIAQQNNLSGDLGAGVTLDLSGWTGEGWPPTTIIPNRVFLPIIVR